MSLPPDSGNLNFLWRMDQSCYKDTAGTMPCTTDGDTISRYVDQGPNLMDAIIGGAATFKTNQINGLPCARYDGSATYFDFLNSYLLPARTMYAVVKIPGSGVYTLLCGNTSALQWRLDSNKQRLVKNQAADIGFGSTTIANNTWTQINVSWDGMNGIFRTAQAVDGTVSFGSNVFGTTRQNGAGGTGPTPNTDWYLTDLALLMDYAVVHTLTVKQLVESWINGIWGV